MSMNEDWTQGLKRFTKENFADEHNDEPSIGGEKANKEAEIEARAEKIKQKRLNNEPGFEWERMDELLRQENIEPNTPEAEAFFRDWDRRVAEMELTEEVEEEYEPGEFLRKLGFKDGGDEAGTPKEWREKLRELINNVKESASGVEDEIKELFTRKKERLDTRSEELDAEAEKIGGVTEKSFRWIGEKYNKLGWKSKLGVGVGLGLGAAAFSTVSLPIVFACWSGIAAQRVAGAASMFLKFENSKKLANRTENLSEEQKKVLMLSMAVIYSIGMSIAVSEAITLVGNSAWGEATHEWLKHHWPFGHTEVTPQTHPEVSQPATSVSAPEMPAVFVDASAGHGYEYMVKQLWEQLHDPAKNFVLPEGADPNSDIAKLFAADENSIDSVVHQIASDPQHGFFNADGTSVQINPTDHIFVAADGQVHISHGFYNNGPVNAPEGAPVTPTYSPETPAETPVPAEIQPPTVPPVEAFPQPEAPPIENPPPLNETPAAQVETPSAPAEAPVVHENIVVNHSGLEIPTDNPHFYADASDKNIFIYGGSATEKREMIEAYLKENPDKIVYSSDANGTNRIAWGVVDGKLTIGDPIQTRSFFNIFKSFMKAPEPDEFARIIK